MERRWPMQKLMWIRREPTRKLMNELNNCRNDGIDGQETGVQIPKLAMNVEAVERVARGLERIKEKRSDRNAGK